VGPPGRHRLPLLRAISYRRDHGANGLPPRDAPGARELSGRGPDAPRLPAGPTPSLNRPGTSKNPASTEQSFGTPSAICPPITATVHNGSVRGYHELRTSLAAQRSPATVRRTVGLGCIFIHRRLWRELTILPRGVRLAEAAGPISKRSAPPSKIRIPPRRPAVPSPPAIAWSGSARGHGVRPPSVNPARTPR
jgi:hypothetical protein